MDGKRIPPGWNWRSSSRGKPVGGKPTAPTASPDCLRKCEGRAFVSAESDPSANVSMSVVHRSFAALCGLLLLQLSLPGSGTLCTMHHSAARNDADAHGMHEMTGMGSARGTRASVSAMSDADGLMSPADCGGMGNHDGCGVPWAPGQCLSMTACAMSATPAARIAKSPTMRAVRLELPSPALLHSGPTFAPALPPPRA
jgi:hypothetical protein